MNHNLSAQLGHPSSSNKAKADKRVERELNKTTLKYEIDKDGDFKMVFKFDDKRSQVLFVRSKTSTFSDLEIRQVLSPGFKSNGKPSRKVLEAMLKQNLNVKIGAWSLMRSGDRVGDKTLSTPTAWVCLPQSPLIIM